MKIINKMMSSSQAYRRLLALVGLVALVAVVQPSIAAEAGETVIEPATVIMVAPAQLRTRQDMERAAAVRSPAPQAIEIPFRPTMSDSEYEEAKRAAAAAAIDSPKRPTVVAPLGPLAPPTLIFQDIEGVDQITACGTCRPPDTHGAAGLTQFVEITNFNLDVFDKATGASLMSIRLANFFGYFTQTIFDPRVVYDSTWNRWVISAEAFEESPTVQLQFLAISQTSDATGPYFIYAIDVNVNDNDDFWDYPQLGMDQDSIIVTANVFGPVTFREARLFAVAKARLYNGLGFLVPLFTGLVGTPQPPIVLDQNFRTFVVAARPGPTTVTKYTLENSSRPNGTTLVASTITVPAFSIPPDAAQPGTTDLLDTLDARFVNASTQNGNSLWNVHTVNLSGFPAPKFYEFDTATNMVIQSGFFFASLTSHDWNASIAANGNNDVYVTWSSTDPPADINAQVRFSGRQAADPLGVIDAGTALFTSPTFYNPSTDTVERWGDYSAVTVDPVDGTGWIVNEKINDSTTWGSRIGQVGF
ncbi:hypothetical protein EPO44_16335 [bacterium]|nr:MAG: hypothetical protein EPO44_16335 [bacterium]